MAFVSIMDLRRNFNPPKITIYSNGGCLLPKSVVGNGCSVEMEIDMQKEAIRLQVGETFPRKLADQGSFSIPKCAYQAIIPSGKSRTVVALEKNEDGWWYGSYGDASNQKGSE